MSTCVSIPRKPNLYVAMTHTSSTFTAQHLLRLSEANSFHSKLA